MASTPRGQEKKAQPSQQLDFGLRASRSVRESTSCLRHRSGASRGRSANRHSHWGTAVGVAVTLVPKTPHPRFPNALRARLLAPPIGLPHHAPSHLGWATPASSPLQATHHLTQLTEAPSLSTSVSPAPKVLPASLDPLQHIPLPWAPISVVSEEKNLTLCQ